MYGAEILHVNDVSLLPFSGTILLFSPKKRGESMKQQPALPFPCEGTRARGHFIRPKCLSAAPHRLPAIQSESKLLLIRESKVCGVLHLSPFSLINVCSVHVFLPSVSCFLDIPCSFFSHLISRKISWQVAVLFGFLIFEHLSAYVFPSLPCRPPPPLPSPLAGGLGTTLKDGGGG